MNQRFFLAAVSFGTFVFASPLVGCGDFSADEEEPAVTGGAPSTGGGAATGGATGDGDGDAASGGTTGDGDGTGGAVEPPPASCDNVVPCGGDVSGNWFAIDSCLSWGGEASVVALGIGCEQAPVTGTLEVSGNLNNDPAETLVADTTQTFGELQIGLGPECLDVSGTMIMCDGVSGPLKSLGFTDPTSCVNSTTIEGGCDCTATVNQASVPGFVTPQISDAALYTAEGNVFTLQGNVTVEYDYCVEGDFMHVTPKTSLGDQATVTGTIVFQRQP